MSCANDGLVAIDNLLGDRLGDLVDRTQEVHDQRPAVKQLVNIQQNRTGTRSRQLCSAGLDRFSLVTLEPANQQLVFVGRWPQDADGRLIRDRPGTATDDLAQFDTPAGPHDDPSATLQFGWAPPGVDFGQRSESYVKKMHVRSQRLDDLPILPGLTTMVADRGSICK
jgi:hypothetical protein